MTEYVSTARCPSCGRAPNVSFSESDVTRAKRERQAARIGPLVKCQRCGEKYWIRARDIAAATPVRVEESRPSAPARKKPKKGRSGGRAKKKA